jgi:hypothetical protein
MKRARGPNHARNLREMKAGRAVPRQFRRGEREQEGQICVETLNRAHIWVSSAKAQIQAEKIFSKDPLDTDLDTCTSILKDCGGKSVNF